MARKISRNTFETDNPPSISSYASVVGKLEGEGPLGQFFDETEQDGYFGQKTWEQGESELQRRTLAKALEKGGLTAEDVDFMFAGDLLNQCIGSTFGLRDFSIPLFGIYGACSTMSEGLALASLMCDSGLGQNIAAITSSHFCSAERQFRFPLSYGCVRTPTAQWTCTASGAVIVSPELSAPFVRGCTVGKIVDLGVTDANNMGAAMAPAAAYVIKTHLDDRGLSPKDFDAIVTGDLGLVGSNLLIELLRNEGMDISKQHKDCGLMMFDRDEQDVHAGGSGCGCSGSVLCGYFLDKIKTGELKNILFCATGALMSTTATQQGESIPSISHAVHISHYAV
ncbi:MAG: stage V sporulation protein AD [Oscillospiraceae bacterium]|nr:stage V sporulation protein AD [Oscillospiraceae bacterium]